MVLDIELDPVDDASNDACIFCAIVHGDAPAEIVLDEPAGIAFLDRRPLLAGHVLLVPRTHVATLPELPIAEIGPFFALAQRLTRAVPQATDADGTFLAVNTIVSQSVPHLHVHIVPRRHGDRLFSRNLAWTRRPYRNDEERRDIVEAIRSALNDSERTSSRER